MRKPILLFFTLLLTFYGGSLFAQSAADSIPNDSLLISEVSIGHHNSFHRWGYFELYNSSSDTLDLSNFWVQGAVQGQTFNPIQETKFKISLKGKLPPKETFLFVGRTTEFRTDPFGNIINPLGYANEYLWEMADMTGENRLAGIDAPGASVIVGGHRLGLFSRTKNPKTGIRDSVRIDQFWFNGNFSSDNEDNPPFTTQHPIAGIVTLYPQLDYIWIRNPRIKYGTLDFNNARGNDIKDSDWMPVPKTGYNQWAVPYTTTKRHGNFGPFQIDAKRADVTIDKGNKRISLPFGIRRDSIIREFNLGPNIAYEFQYGTDSTQHFAMNDDTLIFYHYSDTFAMYKFGLQVAPKPAAFAEVSPLYYKVINPPADRPIEFINSYTVSQGYAVDTIGNVPFATRIDTLLNYLQVHGSSYEFTFVDGINRVDLKDGDQLTVTAPDGTSKKTYLIKVEPYYPSINNDLVMVIFPGLDIFENPVSFEYNDTMHNFNRNVTTYVVSLPEGTKVSPGIQAIPLNANANVHIKRATNLEGTDAERTAQIVVTAEDGVTVKTYSFLFNVEREKPALESEPFFSDYSNGGGWGAGGHTQLFNPNDSDLDLGRYMFFALKNNETWESFQLSWKNDSNFVENNRRVLRPGYMIMPGSDQNPIFATDNVFQRTTTLPPHGEYWICSDNGYPFVESPGLFQSDNVTINPLGLDLRDRVDFMYNGNWLGNANAKQYWWTYKGMEAYPYAPYNKLQKHTPFSNMRWRGHQGEVLGIMKIINDSVLDNIKPMNLDFENDFQIVDIVGGKTTIGQPIKLFMRGYYTWEGANANAYVASDITYHEGDSIYTLKSTEFEAYNMYRKPYVYTGNPVDNASFGIGTQDSVIVPAEWIFYGFSANPDQSKADFWRRGWARNWNASRFKNHVMVTYVHIPYITSKVYDITKGLSEDEKIYGVLSGTTVADFIGNVLKPDPAMTIVVKAGATEKGLNDILAAGDKVTSASADGNNFVTYTIQPLGVLDNNVTLTSTEYTVNVAESKVSNIPFGTTLKELLSKVTAPALAKVAIVGGADKDMVIPFEVYSNDTLADGSNYKVDVKADGAYMIEVLAQNGVTVKHYALEFAATALPVLYSDVFPIEQDVKIIRQVYQMSVAQFAKMVKATPGATITIKSIDGTTREQGVIRFDDNVVVSLGETSVSYLIHFAADENFNSIKPANGLSVTSVYPNPTTGMVRISGLSNATMLKVYNLAGKEIKQLKVDADEVNLDLQKFENGVYLINILGKNGFIETRKVVKF
jgi:hypothetical protein